ncbi:hypothetical protein D3C76_1296110 [compost metagenome]
MAAHVFRRAMYDDIRTKLDRPLEIRCHQRIVHDRKQAVGPRPGRYRLQVRDHHQRIGWRFDNHGFRVVPTCLFQRLQIIGIHIRGRHPILGHNSLQ